MPSVMERKKWDILILDRSASMLTNMDKLKKKYKAGDRVGVAVMIQTPDAMYGNMYGAEFFKSELGIHSDIFWLPDTFGYSAQLPQLMKNFKMDYFLKINKNRIKY